MRFELINLADHRTTVRVNLWNWQPTVELLQRMGMIDARRSRLMCANATHVRINAEEAHVIAEVLRRDVCAMMQPGQRIDPDLRILADNQDFDWEHPERSCSAAYEWLQQFVEFCRSSQGFEVK